MTPKEKSIELFNKFYRVSADTDDTGEIAKKCALICVDEIINLSYFENPPEDDDLYLNYWKQVKEEIEKI